MFLTRGPGRSRQTARRGTFGAALTVLLTSAVLTGAAPASAIPAKTWKVPAPDATVDPMVHLDEFETRIVVKINKIRKAHDLKPVRLFSDCVDHFSEGWAGHLAKTGDFAHRNQLPVLKACDLTWIGETLVRGTGLEPGTAVKAWMDSPDHRAVIMKSRANRAGVGVRLDGEGRIVCVLNFGDTQ